jgi:hypothetical protein
MSDPNVLEPAWEVDAPESPLRGRGVRHGAGGGAARPRRQPVRAGSRRRDLAVPPAPRQRGAAARAVRPPGEGRAFPSDGERPFMDLYLAAMAADAEIDQRSTSTT